MSDNMYPKQNWRLYLDLSIFWFALSFLWAGMITIVMQTLVARMAGQSGRLGAGVRRVNPGSRHTRARAPHWPRQLTPFQPPLIISRR